MLFFVLQANLLQMTVHLPHVDAQMVLKNPVLLSLPDEESLGNTRLRTTVRFCYGPQSEVLLAGRAPSQALC